MNRFIILLMMLSVSFTSCEVEGSDLESDYPELPDSDGDGTEGDGTEGDGTEGDGTEGDGTEGDGTEGDGTEGDGTEGDGTEGDGTEGDGTEGDGTEGDGTEGDGTDGDGTEGDGTEGDGTEGDGTEGDGTEGDGTDGDGTDGDGTDGDGTDGDGTDGDGTDGDGTEGDGTESENSENINVWDNVAIYGGNASSGYRPRSELWTNPILRKYNENGVEDSDFLYIADPAAEVYDGWVYVYCSRDQPTASGWDSMQDYAIVRSKDMITWENLGIFLSPRVDTGFEYASGQMNAPDAARSPVTGFYYFYFPAEKWKVGVAKASNPWGPWVTAVDSYMVEGVFDPTVFVDDDGRVYMYGNNVDSTLVDRDADGEKYIIGAEIDPTDMITVISPWKRISGDECSEAVHCFKRNGIYYFTARYNNYTRYWMSSSPMPDEYIYKESTLVTPYQLVSGTYADAPAHNSVIKFNDQWYIFYQRGGGNRFTNDDEANAHNGSWRVNDGRNCRRSSCFDELNFNADGTIIAIEEYSEVVEWVQSTPYGYGN